MIKGKAAPAFRRDDRPAERMRRPCRRRRRWHRREAHQTQTFPTIRVFRNGQRDARSVRSESGIGHDVRFQHVDVRHARIFAAVAGMRTQLVWSLRLQRETQPLHVEPGAGMLHANRSDPRDVAFGDATRIEHELSTRAAGSRGIQNAAGLGRIARWLRNETEPLDACVEPLDTFRGLRRFSRRNQIATAGTSTRWARYSASRLRRELRADRRYSERSTAYRCDIAEMVRRHWPVPVRRRRRGRADRWLNRLDDLLVSGPVMRTYKQDDAEFALIVYGCVNADLAQSGRIPYDDDLVSSQNGGGSHLRASLLESRDIRPARRGPGLDPPGPTSASRPTASLVPTDGLPVAANFHLPNVVAATHRTTLRCESDEATFAPGGGCRRRRFDHARCSGAGRESTALG